MIRGVVVADALAQPETHASLRRIGKFLVFFFLRINIETVFDLTPYSMPLDEGEFAISSVCLIQVSTSVSRSAKSSSNEVAQHHEVKRK